MATATVSWRDANLFQKVMIVAQGLLVMLAYFATVSGFADLMEMDIDLTRKLTLERVTQVVFVFAVATAVVMAMLIGLHTMLDRERRFTGRVTGAMAYLFFLFWSIAFGFGFFWKTFAAEDFTRGRFNADAATIQKQVDDVIGELRSVEQMAIQAAAEAQSQSEEESRPGGGGTCRNNRGSSGARGPLTIAREDFSADAARTAASVKDSWIAPLTAEAGEIAWRVRALDPASNAALIASDSGGLGEPAAKDKDELDRIRTQVAEGPEGRKAAYDRVSLRANKFVGEAQRLRKSIGNTAQAEFERLAKDMSEPQGRLPNRWCEDPDLAALMTRAAKEIEGLSQPKPISPEIIEGSAAARFATINLARNAIAGVTSNLNIKLPETTGAEELEPLGENDIIALYATAAIDFALLFVTILSRPPNHDRSIFQKLRRIGRDPETMHDDTEELAFDGKLNERNLELRKSAHEARLKVRQQSRHQTEEIVVEDTADIVVENRQQMVLQQRGASVREQLTRVLGNEALAREVALRASETIQRIGKRLYFAITRSDDREANVINRRFANFLNINPGLFRVRPLEKGNRRDDLLIDQIAQRLGVSTNNLIDVFEIESAFGNALLMLPYAPSDPVESVAEGMGSDATSGGHSSDVPTRGHFDDADIFVDAPTKQSRRPEPEATSASDSETAPPDETEPEGSAGSPKSDPGAYAEDRAAAEDESKGNWLQRQFDKWIGPKGRNSKNAETGAKPSKKKGKTAS